jgi:hypothetical protein
LIQTGRAIVAIIRNLDINNLKQNNMTTEEKNKLFLKLEYHRGKADAFLVACSICSDYEQSMKLNALAVEQINIAKEILSIIKD